MKQPKYLISVLCRFDSTSASGPVNRKSDRRRTAARFLAVCSLVGLTAVAWAEPWDNSWGNPYVSSGNGNQCTAYAWGRYKVANGDALTFRNPQRYLVYPNAGLMYDEVVESPTVYKDTTPVRGSLISWSKANEVGHTAIVESVNGTSSLIISEQNWPTGYGPNDKTLSFSEVFSRPSRVNNSVSYYTLRGYVNPNRPPAFGTISTANLGNALRMTFPILDEDRRSLNVLTALFDGNNVVNGTTVSGTVSANPTINVQFNNLAAQLSHGRTYTFRVWATDFRGLRSSSFVTVNW